MCTPWYGDTMKGYRLYDLERDRVIYSQDVQFDESEKTNSTKVSRRHSEDADKLIVDFDSENEEVSNEETSEAPQPPAPVRKSTRERRQPEYYGREMAALTLSTQEPSSYKEATSCPEKAKWKEAMKTEMTSLKENDIWELVELPAGRKSVESKWVYKAKIGEDGTVERYKARLVAQGYTQKYGDDYFCLVARQESLRVLLALSVQCGLRLHQVDVVTAFLDGNLEEEVYMAQPDGFVSAGQEHLVCKLKRVYTVSNNLHVCWNAALDSYLMQIGFTQSNGDPCIYFRDAGGEKMYMGVYVDDIVLAARTDEML